MKPVFEITEFYEGKLTVLSTTDCHHDARLIRQWHIDQWADRAAGERAIKVRNRA